MKFELAAGYRDAAALVDPILNGEIADGRWNSTQRRWDATVLDDRL
jgi:hypothetical protein